MGSMRLCRGDLFKTTSPAIAHGCNVRGSMGAGIAFDIKRVFPAMFDDYKRLCNDKKIGPGNIFVSNQIMNNRPIVVFNLMTQTGFNGADIQFMHEAFDRMVDYANANNISEITIPMIGAGLGGITPSTCFNIYLGAIENFNGRLNVIVQYVENVVPHEIVDDRNDPRNIYKRAKELAEKQALQNQVTGLDNN